MPGSGSGSGPGSGFRASARTSSSSATIAHSILQQKVITRGTPVRRATLIFASLFIVSAALAQAPDPTCLPDSVCPDWTARYDGSALYDHAFDVAVSRDG